MTGEDLKPTMALIAGLWPSPPVTFEEAVAWSGELTGRTRITSEEATTVLTRFAESGLDDAKFRPRPGEIVSMVQGLRRKRALDKPTALEPVTFAANHDDVRAQAIAAARTACDQGRRHVSDLRRARVGAPS